MKSITKFILVNIVLIIMPVADIFFLIPARIASGGFYGLGIILINAFGIENLGATAVSLIALGLTTPLLIYSYYNFDRHYFVTTAYASWFLAIYMFILDRILAYFNVNIPNQGLLASTIWGSVIQGVGIGIIMALGSSTGGTDIVAKIINKYFSFISIGTGVAIANLIIIGVSSIMFGIDKGLAAVSSILITGWAIDLILYVFKKKI